ncbi:hypothetical protein V5G99_01990 [Bibersteinia trehalosi]|uniref:hypothetical protein n=1 Tax=Bibersteinia trehalosi TaxID=47735 RepID=UPI003D2DB157
MKKNRKKSEKVIDTHKEGHSFIQLIKNNKIPIILISAIWSIFTTDILERIANMPIIWKNFEENYLYNKKLGGLWSTNTNYIIDYKLLNIPENQPGVIIELIDKEDNSIVGEMISADLCKLVPLTWSFRLESSKPTLLNLIFDRELKLSYLVNGGYTELSTFKIKEINSNLGTLTLSTKEDKTGIFPPTIKLINFSSSIEDEIKEVEQSCVNSKKQLGEKIEKK